MDYSVPCHGGNGLFRSLASSLSRYEDEFNDYFAVQDRGEGNLPGYQWASGNHTNELVPLWAMGPGAEMLDQFDRTDLRAAELWGEPYGWNGAYIDNAALFHIMNEVFAAEEVATAAD